MKSFLQHIVDDLEPKDLLELKDKCFVFPSRRACVYFNDLLQKKFHDKTFWAPTVLSIEEFVQKHTPELTVVDEIRLLFRLYEIYKREAPSITFDTFYAWGQTLLKDFDEIDRYLVDANLLYTNLQEVEDIESVFGPDEEVIKAIKGFQDVIDTSQEGKLYKEFSATWKIVGKVYGLFKASLLKDGWAYNGLCYRTLAEKLVNAQEELPYKHVIFSGFNALSKSEERIIDSLLTKNLATVYIDADLFYLESEGEEAGYFLRKMKKHWRNNPNIKWIIANGFQESKTINIIGVSQKTAQARAAVGKLNNDGGSTAVVLADETLLMPVLYALPTDETSLNITMGYPIGGSASGNLIKSYLKYQASAKGGSDDNTFFDIKAFSDLVNQPAIKKLIPKELALLANSKSRFMSSNLIAERLLSANESNQPTLKKLLNPAKATSTAIEIISQTILSLYLLNKETESGHDILEERIVYTLVKYLQNLQGIISGAAVEISFTILEKLVKESFKQMSAPFAGEPLASRQIMGFLETRALDFENLVILSVNEDLLPAGGFSNSYIPFGIRKAFKLPTFVEHNSIYAYHFFRLLQRSKNISLIYSTQLSVTGSGEKSRFILQLLNDFDHPTSLVKINHLNLIPNLTTDEGSQPALVYEKTGEVSKQLDDHINSFSKERPLSPTALVDYITCSLKYYFNRILKIREPDKPSSEIDARIFGNILHDILEKIYEPWIGKTIDKNQLEAIIKAQLLKYVDDAFLPYDKNSGEVAFTKHVITYLVKRILQNDIHDTPIKIIDLESRTNPLVYELTVATGEKIPLGGKIDRLDTIDVEGKAVTRVLDYKTGKVELKKNSFNRKGLSIEDYMKAHFEDPKFKSGFQTYFYALLHKRNFPDQGINGGIVGVKKLTNGVEYLRGEASALTDEIIDEYENELGQMIGELMNKSIPFSQTEDSARCLYCDFKSICGR